MSEKKKVIYVKDLVIKADNVHIEPQHNRRPAVDPFFGHRRVEEEMEDRKDDHVEDIEDVEDDHDHKDKQDDDERRPFSWI
ncbi:hypothetical protein [Sediminibacillus massiliensis]|uniref:hypothetical protein n=1 Tax=Sediminibacillus massiliensis TaxID=1926277 RepID=UPI0009885DDE|nr:hypothetical protein [Sediminibacillus massiliensis]